VSIQLLCLKLGMTQIFTENGDAVSVTVLEAGPNTVVQKKTVESDGYSALQLGFGERRPSRTTKAQLGHFQKATWRPTGTWRDACPEEAAAFDGGQSRVLFRRASTST
jgi:large subunit ribosomal protein L3